MCVEDLAGDTPEGVVGCVARTGRSGNDGVVVDVAVVEIVGGVVV